MTGTSQLCTVVKLTIEIKTKFIVDSFISFLCMQYNKYLYTAKENCLKSNLTECSKLSFLEIENIFKAEI